MSNATADNTPPHVTIMGVPIAPMRLGETIAWITAWIRSHSQKAVFTINPEIVMLAKKNDTFARILQGSDLNIADGIGIVLAARIARKQMPERVPGIDLVDHLCRVGNGLGWSIYLLGARPGVAQRAGQELKKDFPNLQIVGWSAASSEETEDTNIVPVINGLEPDLLLVAFGAPAQEQWIARNIKKLNVGVAIGVGGSFDFLASEVSRAPHMVRHIGLEWLYRLLVQPWRWRRMLALPAFAIAAAWSTLDNRRSGKQD
jgi:N-acetylglucosaminyldiphosphoundecaprenol N-acetyl-beta-D-mannosaminyltransferase